MELKIGSRIKNAWNAFQNKTPTSNNGYGGYYRRPDRIRISVANERSIITAIYNRLAIDVASITIRHCRLDDNDRFHEYIDSDLDTCLKLRSNKDQSARAFFQDVVMSMFDEGCVAIVPVDTRGLPTNTTSYDILSLRVGKIIAWYPDEVTVRVYNDQTGLEEDITLPKYVVGLVENPFYTIMNEPNSVLQRLIKKLNILDMIDEQSGSGKLDLIK